MTQIDAECNFERPVISYQRLLMYDKWTLILKTYTSSSIGSKIKNKIVLNFKCHCK